jgi:methyl-accepting chemotaxis protein
MLKSKTPFHFKSIGSLLIFSVAFTIAIVMAGIVFYVSVSSYDLTLKLEQQALAQSAKAAQTGFDQYCDFGVSLARSLAADQQVISCLRGDPDRAQWRLGEAMKATPIAFSFMVFDAQGQILAGINTAGEVLAGGSRMDRDYCSTILKGQEVFKGKTILKAKTGGEGTNIFATSHAIRSADGETIGGVAVMLKWSAFTDRFIKPLRFGEHGYAFMYDAKGTVIAHGTDMTRMFKDSSDQAFTKDVVAKGTGELFYEYKGEKKYLSFSRDDDTGFIVCLNAPESDLASAAISQRNTLIGIGIAAIALLAGGITFILRRLVVRPIQDLQAYADAVAHGDYNAARRTGLRFEIAALAENLYSMVAQLKERLGFAQGVLNAFQQPCAVFDPEDKATFINEHMLRTLEKPGVPKDYLGRTSGDVIWGEPGRATTVTRVRSEGRMLRTEVPFATRSGEKIFDATVCPLNDMDGKVIGTLTVWFELTEIRAQQKRIEEQNVRIAKAAAAANTVSDQVASASEELAAQIEQSSHGSEEQRARTAEAATAMDEMNSTVMEVAKSAGAAAELAERAKAKAKQGSGLVDSVVDTINLVRQQAETLKKDMSALGDQADGIGHILEVISDIADQTNLLALNAAIEAARAGDAGRGFAVVADEVRKLAEKTMAATKQVGDSILAIQRSAQNNIKNTEQTAESIAQSTAMAHKSGQALTEIVDMVDQTADQVRGIATASEQQSAASEEISRSTEEINRIAGETSEAMVQSGQAVSDLARLAQELRTIINNMNA